MTVHIEHETEDTFPFDADLLIKTVAEAVLDMEECPYEASLEVILTDDEAIREVNREMRDLDRATDVLSFPTAYYETPAGFDALEEQDDCFDPDTGEYLLGDMMISVEHAKKQAEEYGHSLRREIAFLTAHSMLHLLGYDHMTDGERAVMEDKQEAVLNTLGITREIGDQETV